MTKKLFVLSIVSLLTWKLFLPSNSHVRSLDPLVLPEEYLQDATLIQTELTDLEREFAKSFPGKIETYQREQGVVIFRQVYGATRRLHDSRTCLLAGGYQLSQATEEIDGKGKRWKIYTGENNGKRITVRSIIIELESTHSWVSVEEWFWHAFFHPSKGYLAITEIDMD